MYTHRYIYIHCVYTQIYIYSLSMRVTVNMCVCVLWNWCIQISINRWIAPETSQEASIFFETARVKDLALKVEGWKGVAESSSLPQMDISRCRRVTPRDLIMFMCLQSQLNSSCPSYRVFRTHPKKSLIVIRSRCQQSQPNVTYGASSQKKLSSLEQKRYGLVSKQRTPKSTQKQILHVWTIPSHNVSQFFC